MNAFAHALLDWFDRHGRRELPWQHPRTAYRVWLSEIMLQQTQVGTVVGYFQRFVDALPDLPMLAAADEDTVLGLWSGLGYYRRARFLHYAAQLCMQHHGGQLPTDFDALLALPGIGRSTAGAILAQAHGLRFPILDGNVKRVLARYHGVHGHPGQSSVEKILWQHAGEHTPAARTADYTQAIMDLGATVCTPLRPRCDACPVADGCVALHDGTVAQLPTPRPAKTTPQRATVMLLLRDDAGRIALERRGDTGVWAGLWSLPEAPSIDAAWRMARSYARIDDATALPVFNHAFSHYRLRVEPLLFDQAQPIGRVADDAVVLRWYARDQLVGLGLPSPVRNLLASLDAPPPPLFQTAIRR